MFEPSHEFVSDNSSILFKHRIKTHLMNMNETVPDLFTFDLYKRYSTFLLLLLQDKIKIAQNIKLYV